MNAQHILVMGKIAEQIANVRTSLGYTQQQLERARRSTGGRDVESARTMVEQREDELSYWLDIEEFARNNVLPSVQAQEYARAYAQGNVHHMHKKANEPRPAWTDGPETMRRANATRRLAESAGLMRQARDTLRVNNESAQQHPTN